MCMVCAPEKFGVDSLAGAAPADDAPPHLSLPAAIHLAHCEYAEVQQWR